MSARHPKTTRKQRILSGGRRRLRGLLHPEPPLAADAGPYERAVAGFNSSEAGRTVASLVRTLGIPRASVGARAGAPGEVRVTIAWELSWYQWGVDLGGGPRSISQLDKGGEIEQLDAAARQWNAVVDEDGVLRLVGGSPRR